MMQVALSDECLIACGHQNTVCQPFTPNLLRSFYSFDRYCPFSNKPIDAVFRCFVGAGAFIIRSGGPISHHALAASVVRCLLPRQLV